MAANPQTPALAWNLVSILAAAQEQFSYAQGNTLNALYALYELKLISYPRTDTTYLPQNIYRQARKLGKALQDHVRLVGFDPKHKGPVWDDERVGSHHGIVPLKASAAQLALANLSEIQMNIYRLVCERFVELFQAKA
jgi:DNA topoisomerase-3